MNPCATSLACLFFTAAALAAQEPVTPKETIKLFNGKDMTGLSTWLKDKGRANPKGVFRARDGLLHITGDGFGYVATRQEYRDYHLTVEYRWGKKTDGGKYVRNSGILLHAVGPDGGAGGTWMSSIECQLAQGCVGDLIVIRGKDKDDKVIPVRLKAETTLGADKRPRWKAGGDVREFTKGQLWWHKHEAGFKELLDTRGKDDLESPLGGWTKVECICKADTIEVRVNGASVNKAFDVYPAAGKILLQSEGYEIYFREFDLKPLEKAAKDDGTFAKVELKGKLSHHVSWRDGLGRCRPEQWGVSSGQLSFVLEFPQGNPRNAKNAILLERLQKNVGNTVLVTGMLGQRDIPASLGERVIFVVVESFVAAQK